jgi:hypothetical protein
MHDGTDAAFGPNYDLLTEAVHKENRKRHDSSGRKQNREDHQSRDHFPNVIEAQCHCGGEPNPNPLRSGDRSKNNW